MNSSESDRLVTRFEVEAFPVTTGARLAQEFGQQPPLWDDANDEQRDAIVALVDSALGHLRNHIEEWLPEAIVARSNTRFAVVISWENGMLHDEVLRQQVQAERDRQERLADLLRMTQPTTSE